MGGSWRCSSRNSASSLPTHILGTQYRPPRPPGPPSLPLPRPLVTRALPPVHPPAAPGHTRRMPSTQGAWTHPPDATEGATWPPAGVCPALATPAPPAIPSRRVAVPADPAPAYSSVTLGLGKSQSGPCPESLPHLPPGSSRPAAPRSPSAPSRVPSALHPRPAPTPPPAGWCPSPLRAGEGPHCPARAFPAHALTGSARRHPLPRGPQRGASGIYRFCSSVR